MREGIILPLDQHFVVYPGGAGVDEGADVEEGDFFYTGSSTPAPPVRRGCRKHTHTNTHTHTHIRERS